MAGKGSLPRKYSTAKYDDCPLWKKDATKPLCSCGKLIIEPYQRYGICGDCLAAEDAVADHNTRQERRQWSREAKRINEQSNAHHVDG